jgi:hypothetical protein
MPYYVERGGEVSLCPPGVAMGTRAYCFVLEADRTKLAEMFDRYLNEPSMGAVHYEPVGSLVILMFANIPHLSATLPPDVRMGYMVEREVAVWTLGYDTVRQQFSMFNPYMIVNHPWAMAMGREVYGFPKQLGVVTLPDDGKPDKYALDLPGVEQWGPDNEFACQRFLAVIESGAETAAPPRCFSSQGELVAATAEIVLAHHSEISLDMTGQSFGSRAERDAKLLEVLSFETLPIVLLKQIRDARTPMHACFQAVQLADFSVLGFRGAGELPGRHSLQIQELANEPLRRELGFAAGPVPAVTAFWVDFDFEVTVSKELWRADTEALSVTMGPVSKSATVGLVSKSATVGRVP